MKLEVALSHPPPTSFRAEALRGLFDLEAKPIEFALEVDLALEGKPWDVGALVGPSGSGKSTVARKAWPEAYFIGSHEWTSDSILDDFDSRLSMEQIVDALTSVGFSSPPRWLLPYRCLSIGQQARADLARALTTDKGLIVYDEFTSVVDRIVAASMSHAVSRYARRAKRRFVAVTCHSDILSWLEPDWYCDLDTGLFHWGRLQRPHIELRLRRGTWDAWTRFRHHHYLDHGLNRGARCFLIEAKFDGIFYEVGFLAMLSLVHKSKRGWDRVHRLVVLPDFQGLGLGSAALDLYAENLWEKRGRRLAIRTSHPGLERHFNRSAQWFCSSARALQKRQAGPVYRNNTPAWRTASSWVYSPKSSPKQVAPRGAPSSVLG